MFWRRKPRLNRAHAIFMSDAACAVAFVADVRELLSERQLVLVITHFSETHKRVGERLAAGGVSGILVSDAADLAPRSLGALCKDGAVALIPFPVLRLASPFTSVASVPSAKASVLVPEIYPTRARDALVEEFAGTLPFETSVSFYVSLESPIMKFYGSERIAPLLDRLGMEATARLEHQWLTDAVCKAQERIGTAVREDCWAASPDEWFRANTALLHR